MKKNLNILIVEDDPNLGLLLTEYLKAKGYKATLANDGQKGYDLFKSQMFNFLILDVMMPVKDGFTLAKEIRQINNEIPILFLTAKSMKEDTLKGFEVGADDYMTKPFSMEELLARMEAILRRSGIAVNEMEASFEIGKFQFDKTKQLLIGGKEEHKLTTKENDLLYLLCKNKNGVLERDAALKFIWGDDNYFNGRSMDVYIAKLRKYLKEDPTIEIINVHGRGFKLLVSE
ncbi:MAG: two-component system OmpR family response regulator [Flavobacteriales bacterium]|jgi:two-component system OmpR family response regulator